MFFVIWIGASLLAWAAIFVGFLLGTREARRREDGSPAHLLLGRWFILPGIGFGLVAFLLPILAMVQGIELLEATSPEFVSRVPEWVYWVIAIGLIGGLLFSIFMGVATVPRLFAQRVLVLKPGVVELRNRFTRRMLARIAVDQPFDLESTLYAIQSGNSNEDIIYTQYEELTLKQGEQSLRVQVRGETGKEPAPMLPPRLTPNRIHFDEDVEVFEAHREGWRGKADA
jgi:hypothetical protein